MNFLKKLKYLILPQKKPKNNPMKKFLIVGLGNPGSEYQNTRHNIGFKILDRLAEEKEQKFETKKLADITAFKLKGRTFILIKPNTFMNLSGKAVKYWMDKEKIPQDHLLVITDDVNLPFGTIRIKARGSSGGHNGLQNINDTIGNQQYARLRFGIGGDYKRGQQIDYVLGKWTEEELKTLPERIEKAAKAIPSFGLAGLNHTMNTFNGK